ncbi:MAG: hypothetical protein LUE29_09790 [Lachnospiraceae bacterium]|nr:hypothetical protein [Lachnospiraceae bacterium]
MITKLIKYLVSIVRKDDQPDIIPAAGGYWFNPNKHFSKKRINELQPELERLNKSIGHDTPGQ